METPPITNDDIQKAAKQPIPFIIKLLLWVTVGACATLTTVTSILFYQNKDLYNRLNRCEANAGVVVVRALESERIRTAEALHRCDSIGNSKDNQLKSKQDQIEALLQYRINENIKEINKLDKALTK